jgi:hypothetical protein
MTVYGGMYEIWSSAGNGTEAGPRFRFLEDALRYISAHANQASFAIRMPNGCWYRPGRGSASVIFERAAR